MTTRWLQAVDQPLLARSLRLFLPIGGALTLVLLPMVALYEHTRRDTLQARVEAVVGAGSVRVRSTLQEIAGDTQATATNLERIPELQNRPQLQQLLTTQLLAYGRYSALALVDPDGKVAVEVHRGSAPQLGGALPAAIQRGLRLQPRQVWLSPVLWPRNGPPSLLALRRLDGPGGQRLGVLLAVASLEPLVRDFDRSLNDSPVERGYLLSGDGRILNSGGGSAPGQSFAAQFPAVWRQMRTQGSGALTTGISGWSWLSGLGQPPARRSRSGLFVFETSGVETGGFETSGFETNSSRLPSPAVVLQVPPASLYRSSAFAQPAGLALVALLYGLAWAASVGITAYQRRLAALAAEERETHGQLQAVMRTTGVGMGLCDPASGRFHFVNDALDELLGRSREELLACCWQELTHPADRPLVQQLVESLRRGECSHDRLRARWLRPDGGTVWGDLMLTCTRDHGGAVRNLILQISDVSELVEQAAYLEAAASAGVVGVWDWDVVRDVLTHDAVMSKLYGRRPDQGAGASEAWMSAIHPEDRARVEAEIQAALKGWRPYQPRFRVIWPDGSIHHLQARSRTTYGEDGQALRMIGVNYDITEQVERQQEVEQQRTLLATTLDALVDPLLILNLEAGGLTLPQLRIAALNPAAAAFFGRSKSQLEGQLLTQVLPAELNPELHGALLAAAQGGEPLLVDEQPLQLRQPTSPLHVDVRAIAVRHGLVLSVRDVSQRREAIQQLAASEERFRLLAENSGDVVLLLANDGVVRWVSPSLTAALGWLPEEWIGTVGTQFLVHGGEADHYQANREILQQGGSGVMAREQVRAKDGSIHWIETHASPYINAAGVVDGIVASIHVIDEMVEAEQQLRQSEQRHRLLADNAMDVVWSIDLTGQFTYMSPSVQRLRGFSPNEVMAMRLEQNFTPASFTIVQTGLAQAMQDIESGRPVWFEAELEEICKDGSTVWTDVKATSLYNEQGQVLEIVGVTRNVTAQRQLREALRISEERYRLLAENARDVIWTIDADGRFSYVSPSVQLLRGYTPEEAMVQSLEQTLSPASRLRYQAYFEQLLNDHQAGRPPQTFRGELEYYCRDGSTIWVEVIALPTFDDQGRFQKLLGTSRDISERKRYESQLMAANQQLQELAITDGLTGIGNRRHLEISIAQALERSDRYGEPLSLILCDIDHFKRINDRLGHQVGDQVLIEFCRRIQRDLRSSDCFGRWGGEEFLILLPQCDAAAAKALTEKLRQLIADAPFPAAGAVSASFGVAQRLAQESEAAWLRRVDDCLYAAKEAGRNLVVCA